MKNLKGLKYDRKTMVIIVLLALVLVAVGARRGLTVSLEEAIAWAVAIVGLISSLRGGGGAEQPAVTDEQLQALGEAVEKRMHERVVREEERGRLER